MAVVDLSVTVKGSPVRSFQKFIEEELSPSQKEAVFAALPPEMARRFATPILATESVPVHILNRVTEESARVRDEPVDEFARRAGRSAASEAVRGIWRFFALVLTPPAILSKASQMWSSLYNRGNLEVADQTERSARIALIDFPSEAAGCARITGWIERMGELTGAKNMRVEQTQCYAKGASHCEWSIRWE